MEILKRYSVLLLLLACSCMTQKKWAEGCAERFPVKASTVYVQGATRYDTTYLPGDTLVFSDTVTVDCDTVKGVITKYINQVRPCPPVQIRTVSQVDTVVTTVENRAALAAEQLRSHSIQVKLDRQVKISRFFTVSTIALSAIGFVFLYAGGKLSFITKLFK
ncbi:hypothetical protein ACFOTA_06950 [Chitinophaga sp. GCM10012297]|uniref:Uncharacterized protein n=1 Tax=Chitinophaga chungangae TaxID=2821488 RepID=A0ABS3YB79_9BACT|nr:hypothetical protein [Chitinophaga chungangae]MBO9151937.1 hypothetical protein [Chitinophaga chungangae]